ncbi:hypothetical protein K2173_004887 [Erythroxylum novogranatense]|uniref:Amino acid transporter transmembrane domain-containing protein n=1 Tax=Erythroxylum novogranatense TaxID=1862640 RepID=A0AAV8TD25_9ROSI|nr:hypothetical protein K2173_004887 [Erythroxylum novogranatense]
MMPAAVNLDAEIEGLSLLSDENEENQQLPQVYVQGGAKNSLYITANQHDDPCLDDNASTAHQISKESWVHACAVLTTCINSAYILGYSEIIMVHLGWVCGVVGFIAATTLSLYASGLIAKLHEYDGKRHIRYRDLAGYIYGKKGYYTIWILQYLNLFMANIGFIIMVGSAFQGVYNLFRDDNALKLSQRNLIAGLACFILAIMVPHLSAMAVWLRLSAIFTVIYVVVALAVSIGDGVKAPPRDYSIPGTLTGRIFMAILAISNCFVPFSTGMIPEIQATLRAPATENMIKALCVQFTVGVIPIYAVVFIGYWAYGSSTSSYLLNNASGPAWAKAFANVAAFFQATINFHILACPSYEYFDTKYGLKGSALAIRNLLFRITIRGSYLLVTSLIAALLPFFGDFIGLIGSICVLPLTFVIPNHMYLVAKGTKLNSLQKLWHWFFIIIFSVMSVSATIASVRLIVIDFWRSN